MSKLTAASYPTDALDPDEPTGLILAGMGGPDGPAAVGPFLRNLFRDPAVLPLPAPMARIVGSIIARGRAGGVRRRYESLGFGGGSPQLSWASRQCEELKKMMGGLGLTVYAEPAMRYWHPFPDEAVAGLLRSGARQFLVLPAYPQFSHATSGTALSATCSAVRSAAGGVRMHVIQNWHLLPGYLEALAARSEAVLRSWAAQELPPMKCAFLPVAHSLPERFIRNGDPYLDQTRATVEMVRSRLAIALSEMGDWWEMLPGGGRPLLAFQSKLGPVRWIGPDASSETRRLAAAGCRSLLVLPVSFTCEHIETLYELDVELAATARRAGILEFHRAEALNLDSRWLASLADHVVSAAFAKPDDARTRLRQEVGRVRT